MKAQVVESSGSGTGVGGVKDGKVHKSKHHPSHSHKEVENAEIKAYLNKLQELVPFMPKNRKLSKFEIITHVITYIRDLRQTLGLPPCTGNNDFDLESASIISQAANPQPISNNNVNNPFPTSYPQQHHSHPHHHQRQPLCVISEPNVLSGEECNSNTLEIPPLMDKSPSADDVDTRPVSC